MAYCVKCGNQLSDGSKFCPKCGTPVTITQANNDSSENGIILYSIELISSGPAILQVIKRIMDLLGVEMREAKDIINTTPSTLVTGISHPRAEEIALSLQNIGAEVVIKQKTKSVRSNKPVSDNPAMQLREQDNHIQRGYTPVSQEAYTSSNGSGTTSFFRAMSLIFAILTIIAGLVTLYFWFKVFILGE